MQTTIDRVRRRDLAFLTGYPETPKLLDGNQKDKRAGTVREPT